jgi:hypothetical protein
MLLFISTCARWERAIRSGHDNEERTVFCGLSFKAYVHLNIYFCYAMHWRRYKPLHAYACVSSVCFSTFSFHHSTRENSRAKQEEFTPSDAIISFLELSLCFTLLLSILRFVSFAQWHVCTSITPDSNIVLFHFKGELPNWSVVFLRLRFCLSDTALSLIRKKTRSVCETIHNRAFFFSLSLSL